VLVNCVHTNQLRLVKQGRQVAAKPIIAGSLYEVKGFGHCVQIEAPDAFAAICTFLDRFSTKE
jgi:pimeloyl-ACP methyl ester carboxylesterase